MIRSLMLVLFLFCVCTFLKCSAGNPGSSLDNRNVAKLNIFLKAKIWKKLEKEAQFKEYKLINGDIIDMSDLLSEGADGSIVTPANYIDKLVKSTTVLSCIYGEGQKYLVDMFVKIIAGRCKSMGSDESMLDCMERFWQTIDISKPMTEKMLRVLYIFRKVTKAKRTKTVIDVLEGLLPHMNRQKYIKSNYIDEYGAFKKDDFVRDSAFFFDKMNCASIILRDFLMDRCWPSLDGKNVKYDNMIDIEEMAYYTSHNTSIDELFDTYVIHLRSLEKE